MNTVLSPKGSKNHGVTALGLTLAAALGAALGLIFAPKDGSAIRNNLMEKVKDLAHRFNKSRAQIQETVKDIFGEVTDELEKDYIEIRSHILAAVDELGEKANLTKRKFEDIVDDATDEFASGRDWSNKAKKNLIDSLKGEWDELRSHFEKSQEEEVA